MTKKEFIELINKKGEFESKAKAERTLNTILETITDTLIEGEFIHFIGWGKFEVIERPAREGRNPQTGKPMKIAAKKVVKFKAGSQLNETVK